MLNCAHDLVIVRGFIYVGVLAYDVANVFVIEGFIIPVNVNDIGRLHSVPVGAYDHDIGGLHLCW
jgi:hypothetical protein